MISGTTSWQILCSVSFLVWNSSLLLSHGRNIPYLESFFICLFVCFKTVLLIRNMATICYTHTLQRFFQNSKKKKKSRDAIATGLKSPLDQYVDSALCLWTTNGTISSSCFSLKKNKTLTFPQSPNNRTLAAVGWNGCCRSHQWAHVLLSPINDSQDWQAPTAKASQSGEETSRINSCYLSKAHTTTNESSGLQHRLQPFFSLHIRRAFKMLNSAGNYFKSTPKYR